MPYQTLDPMFGTGTTHGSLPQSGGTIVKHAREQATKKYPLTRRIARIVVLLRYCSFVNPIILPAAGLLLGGAGGYLNLVSYVRNSLSRPLVRASDSHMAISALEWWAA
jgi:hypothetical protein